MRQVGDSTEERDVSLTQLEDGAILDAARQEDVTDEWPGLNRALFLVVLSTQTGPNTQIIVIIKYHEMPPMDAKSQTSLLCSAPSRFMILYLKSNLFGFWSTSQIKKRERGDLNVWAFSQGQQRMNLINQAATYLHDGRGNQELFHKGAGGEVVTEADGQMLQDGLDRMSRLLACDPQVLLQRAGHWRENGLGRFVRIHRHCWTWLVLIYFYMKIRDYLLIGINIKGIDLPGSAWSRRMWVKASSAAVTRRARLFFKRRSYSCSS